MFSASQQNETEAAIASQFQEQLESLDFAEALPETTTPAELDRAATSTIRYLLQSGNGYKDGIDDFVDKPTAANNWLYDAESEAFRGSFIDRRPGEDRVFKFEIKRKGETWERTYQPISGVGD